MRRNSVGRHAGLAFSGVCFVLALVIVSPLASAVRPTLTFLPPYTGGTVVVGNTTYSSACQSHAALVQPPAFNLTSGKVRFSVLASAGHGPTCSPGGHSGSASASAAATVIGASFLGVGNGVYVFRPIFDLTWQVNVTTTTGVHHPSSYALAYLELWVTLSDLTSGSSWSTSPYFNGTSLSNANSSLAHTLHTNLSLPVLVPLTKGDSYSFVVTFYGEVDASVGTGGANTAVAKLIVGSVGAGMGLVKVTIA
jgi:hypothetical protein